jgi:PleD family two-component response regulator
MEVPLDPAPGTRRRRVLIVEDHADSRDMLRMLLELEGHDVLEASCGAQAVKIILDEQVDVALIDLSLPDFDGLQIARHTRLLALSPRPFLVAVTVVQLLLSPPIRSVWVSVFPFLAEPAGYGPGAIFR